MEEINNTLEINIKYLKKDGHKHSIILILYKMINIQIIEFNLSFHKILVKMPEYILNSQLSMPLEKYLKLI